MTCTITSIAASIVLIYKISYKRLTIIYSIYEISGKEEEVEENILKQFYGPPTNCTELGQLGYTLNGYYLVNGSHSSRQIEVVLCRFKLPPRNNESTFLMLILHANRNKMRTNLFS